MPPDAAPLQDQAAASNGKSLHSVFPVEHSDTMMTKTTSRAVTKPTGTGSHGVQAPPAPPPSRGGGAPTAAPWRPGTAFAPAGPWELQGATSDCSSVLYLYFDELIIQ